MVGKGTYTLKVRDKFSCAHILVGYAGDCGCLHGHTFRVEVNIEFNTLNELDMAEDFRDIKRRVRGIIKPLDHAFLNEVLMHDHPTAELIARFIYEQVQAFYDSIVSVVVWESDDAGVEYRE